MSEQAVSATNAKKQFSELLGKVAHGKEQILITKRGKPITRLVPVNQSERNLRDVKGWLDENDSFFKTIDSIITNRKNTAQEYLPELKVLLLFLFFYIFLDSEPKIRYLRF